MFENITAAPADPILGLADLFRADDRPGKINLGIGVYKDETGKTPVLTSVKKAEQYLLENETTKNYLGIDGIPEFARCTQELLFGKGSALINDKRARAQAGDVVLFHGCCHNPTGIDPTLEQWQVLAELSVEKGWLPLFDFAYQGFARGLEEDAEGLRAFAALHKELIVASSYSKNFGLYNERVGACTLVAADAETVDRAFSQMKSAIRANYSNPPAHGASIVATILSNDALRAIWEQELTDMRQRIQRMRQLFVNTLQEKGANRDFSFIIKQNGMFSFSGLTKDQVLRLREEFGVYAVASGRVNVAGMTPDNMAPLCEAIVAVL